MAAGLLESMENSDLPTVSGILNSGSFKGEDAWETHLSLFPMVQIFVAGVVAIWPSGTALGLGPHASRVTKAPNTQVFGHFHADACAIRVSVSMAAASGPDFR